MKQTASQVVTAGVGTLLRLTPAQTARMTGLVVESKTHKGMHEVLAPVQFKIGEEFDTEAEIQPDVSTGASRVAAAPAVKKAAVKTAAKPKR